MAVVGNTYVVVKLCGFLVSERRRRCFLADVDVCLSGSSTPGVGLQHSLRSG